MGHTGRILTVDAVLVGALVGVLTAVGMYFYNKRKRPLSVPTLWEPVARIKRLYIYPLKSGQQVELQRALCTDFGVKMPRSGKLYQFHDRNLVVYTESNNEFQTARQHPKMTFIKAVPTDEEHFTLDAPGMATLVVKIPTSIDTNPRGHITLHKGERIPTVDCGDEAAKWLSRYILNHESGMRLGFHDGLRRRNIKQTHKKYLEVHPNLGNEATGMYSDLSSYLLINQASIDELRSNVPDANISVRNFRPNIVVEGENAGPYIEDNWKWIKIGDVVLYDVRPCTRCVLTTIDPDTGFKSETNEPLRTLRTYRLLKDVKGIELDGHLPVMGVNMGLKEGGEISVGDVVYVGRDI